MYVNVVDEFDRFVRTGYKPNSSFRASIEGATEKLGAYCRWLADQHEDLQTDEGDWLDLWDALGVSAGDGAEIVATTLSKMPAP